MVKKDYLIIACFLCLTACLVSRVSSYDGRVLERTMKGSDVAEIQRTLNLLGYQVAVDGYFGLETENAVRSFQQMSRISVDGIIGPKTLKALRSTGRNQIHRVQRGDSLSALAVKYASSVADIMDANDLTDDTIYIGQKLVIPPAFTKDQSGQVGWRRASEAEPAEPPMVTYKVQPGENTYTIAKRFNTTVSVIQAVNNLQNPSRLLVGQSLCIPSVGTPSANESFCWPVQGRISSGYGWRQHPIYKNRQFHGGIDIAIPTGTRVKAAASGLVILAGKMGGFGLGVVIDHGNKVTTWYGHNSKLLVRPGERVAKGQTIAESGSTGVSTGPHLDFRIKVNGNTVNPLYWLKNDG